MIAKIQYDAYSHWSQTGPAPRPHSHIDPLKSAIGFERYRLSVIARWPDGEEKRERADMIAGTLRRLESEKSSTAVVNPIGLSQKRKLAEYLD